MTRNPQTLNLEIQPLPATMSAQVPPPAAGSSRFLLLDKRATIRDLRNETTAAALTESGLAIQVSFVFADPPRLSHLCVYCPNRDETPFEDTPSPVEVVSSVEDTALIRVHLAAGKSPQYFLYRARGANNGGPSLDLLPDIHWYSLTEYLFLPLSFVSHSDGGERFVMAALSYGEEDGQYNLHTLGSEPNSTWSKTSLQMEIPNGLPAKSAVIEPSEVIALGGGLLGWVDVSKGTVICDVLNPAATASFVPMPKLLPNNSEVYGNQHWARQLRDVTFSRGYIWCVEFEQLVKLRPVIVPVVPDPWDMDELYDSELAVKQLEEEEEVYDTVGWRLITWYRALTWNSWRKGSTVHSDEVGTVSLPQLGGGASALELTFKDLKTAAPTLRGDDDVVYLVSMLDENDKTAWIVTVDTKRKSLGEVMPFSAEHGSLPYYPNYIPCVLTKYLDANSDGAHVGMQDACHAAPQSLNMPEKKRQRLSQAEPEEQEPVSQLLQPSSAAK